jgi:cytochrome c2
MTANRTILRTIGAGAQASGVWPPYSLTWDAPPCSHSGVFGSPDLATALVLIALSVFVLLTLLSYHAPRRNYVGWGIGILVFATCFALLTHSLSQPGASQALVLLLVTVGVMMVLLTYQSRRWAHGVWWVGVLLFFLALPMLGVGRGDLALLGLIGGPGLLMLVAHLHPEVPAAYSRIGVPEGTPLTAADLAAERGRYSRLAATITVVTLAGVWLSGGVPRGEVIEAAPVITAVDEAAAARGATLFQEYGCAACHSTTSAAPGTGPGLLGLAGRRERLDNGTQVWASEEYIRESILQPDAKTVNGYARGVMTSAVAPRMAEIQQTNNIRALVEFIKSLKAP